MIEELVHVGNDRRDIKSKIDLDRFGVVIVDMQQTFLGAINIYEKKMMYKAQEKILSVCIEKDYPVLVLEYEGNGKTVNTLSGIIKNVNRKETFSKNDLDGFTNDYLLKKIDELNLDTLCFMGVSAVQCVKSTMSSAVKKGKRALTARQLIASSERFGDEFKAAMPWFQEEAMYVPNYLNIIELMNKKN